MRDPKMPALVSLRKSLLRAFESLWVTWTQTYISSSTRKTASTALFCETTARGTQHQLRSPLARMHEQRCPSWSLTHVSDFRGGKGVQSHFCPVHFGFLISGSEIFLFRNILVFLFLAQPADFQPAQVCSDIWDVSVLGFKHGKRMKERTEHKILSCKIQHMHKH